MNKYEFLNWIDEEIGLKRFDTLCENCAIPLTIYTKNRKKTFHCSECKMLLSGKLGYKNITKEFTKEVKNE